ncbi:hypothetical protein [Flavobacterium sp. CS20]|uniref:hypothetical protein n=1 Tax=Flavobacterium sp. CS20 TaxID=2775246 RepID=UPI001B3A5E17|nr:hypothetical protein [Flavobacterium sp. CS20]QTY27801.1 hypothetical protein IGB25_04580 [Flavobacterium sp. CS20]
MTAHRFLLSIFLFLFLIGYSQEKNSFPKDTIYIKFNKNIHSKKILSHPKYGKNLYFKGIGTYYNFESKTDTLKIDYLKKIEFSDLKKIEKLESIYYKKRFGRNPWIKNKNAVFVTYVIEKISEYCIVKYPVIWRNEGIKD